MKLEKNIWEKEELFRTLKEGGIVVMPTDTIYGILGSALNPQTVEKIYKIKKRSPEKLCINLIGDLDELKKFNVEISPEQKKQIENFTIPTSFIADGISFRFPQNKEFRSLLLKTGPLIAPSANPEGLPPAQNIGQAKMYFGDTIDLYVDGGEISGKASRIIKLNSDGSVAVIRD